MPPVLCLYLLYGPYTRLLTHKKTPAPVLSAETKRFRGLCAAVTAVMLAAGVADKLAFVMSSAYRGSDTAGSIVSIIAVVCLCALAAACVAYIVKNSARGRRTGTINAGFSLPVILFHVLSYEYGKFVTKERTRKTRR